MGLLVVGSIGLDEVETPRVKRSDLLGGSAVYFSVAARFFSPVQIVGVVGDDFPAEHRRLLETREIDVRGLEVVKGKTFRWSGKYHANMVDRDTVRTDLNVFANFDPKLPPEYRTANYLFLANGETALQLKVLDIMDPRPKFVAADTMDLWIRNTRPDLEKLLRRIDALVLNDSEARMLTGEHELLKAGRMIQKMGPSTVILKKGEHGAMLLSRNDCFILPAYPLDEVVDPTGAGDSFAGGIMGCLAASGDLSTDSLRRALLYGTITASFTCQGFSLDGLLNATREAIDTRCASFRKMLRLPK
jgi:cytidine kinase